MIFPLKEKKMLEDSIFFSIQLTMYLYFIVKILVFLMNINVEKNKNYIFFCSKFLHFYQIDTEFSDFKTNMK